MDFFFSILLIFTSFNYICSLGLSLGLLPAFGKVDRITSRGLQWSLDDNILEYGKLISSSNRIADIAKVVSLTGANLDGSSGYICEAYVVEVEATNDVLWTSELN